MDLIKGSHEALTARPFTQELEYDPKEEAVLRITGYAAVTDAWTTQDPSILGALAELHIWKPESLLARLNWRPKQKITVTLAACSDAIDASAHEHPHQPVPIPTGDGVEVQAPREPAVSAAECQILGLLLLY